MGVATDIVIHNIDIRAVADADSSSIDGIGSGIRPNSNVPALIPDPDAMFVIAMLTYAKNKDLGIKFFTLIMDMDVLARNPGNPLNVQGYVPNGNTMSLVRQLDTRPYLPGIYIVGTTVENSYAVSLPATIEFRQATVRGEDTVSLYALTTSGNMARPITLRKNSNGLWKATEFSSMFVGASRIPRTQRVDNL